MQNRTYDQVIQNRLARPHAVHRASRLDRTPRRQTHAEPSGAGWAAGLLVALRPSRQTLPYVTVLGRNPKVLQALVTTAVRIACAHLPFMDTPAKHLRQGVCR